MDTEGLKKFLIKKHCSLPNDRDTSNKHVSGEVTTLSIGSLVWVKSRISCGFTVKWYSRAATERTTHSYKYWQDWVGNAETAPKKITRPKKLNEWARLSTTYNFYQRNPEDINDNSYLKCSGRWVEEISEKGKATLKVASLIEEDGHIWATLECKEENKFIQL